jgi:hypothetical protein
MMSPPAYVWARHDAAHHLQVEIVERGEVEEMPAEVPTRVRVVRVFKSSSDLGLGAELSLQVKVFRDVFYEDSGGWLSAERYHTLRYVEVYLNGVGQARRLRRGAQRSIQSIHLLICQRYRAPLVRTQKLKKRGSRLVSIRKLSSSG